mmetsp:Transcript_278/g.770  ORF Transcript_278/g.770 Transcript_278/m.770 type:complete len:299 (-) Transcript_278:47-943(-)
MCIWCQDGSQQVHKSARRWCATRAHRRRRSPRQPLPTPRGDPAGHSRGALLRSAHAPDEVVDLVLAVAVVAALDKVLRDLLEAAVGVGELEGPEEVGGVLEAGADGDDLVDQVLRADDARLAECLLDSGVVVEWDAVLARANLAVAALVNELAHRLEVRVAVGDVRLDLAEHVDRRLVGLDEDAIVQLAQPEELQDLLDFRVHRVDAADAHHEEQLRLGLDEEVARALRLAPEADQRALLRAVLLDVRLSTLEDRARLRDPRLARLRGLGGLLRVETVGRLALLEHRLRDRRLRDHLG